MTGTYGSNSSFPGVKVTLESGDIRPTPEPPDLTESEYQLITILIWMTLDVQQPPHTVIGVDVDAASSALQCFGYDQYEATPMVWETLNEIGERVYG